MVAGLVCGPGRDRWDAAGVGGVVQSGLFSEWSGVNYLVRLLNPDEGVISFYSTGRFESGSTVSQVVTELLSMSPIAGVGAGGWVVPYDGALSESLVTADVLGLILYLLVLAAVFVVAKRTQDLHRRRFVYLFAVLLVGSAAGFSPLTGNRISTITWIIIALFVLCNTTDDQLTSTPDAPKVNARSKLLPAPEGPLPNTGTPPSLPSASRWMPAPGSEPRMQSLDPTLL